MNICLLCGAEKKGAFVPCPTCRHEMRDDKDRAEHLVASELSDDELTRVLHAIRSKRPVALDEQAVARALQEVESVKDTDLLWFALKTIWPMFVLIALGCGLVGWILSW